MGMITNGVVVVDDKVYHLRNSRGGGLLRHPVIQDNIGEPQSSRDDNEWGW